MKSPPKYPHVTVRLSGSDGNAFAIVGAVRAALGRSGVPKDAIDAFAREATAGDYDHLLQVTMSTVNVK